EERASLGIFTTGERSQPTLPGVDDVATVSGSDLATDPPSVESAEDLLSSLGMTGGVIPVADPHAPICMQCGITMQRAGRCHACPGCGNTSGCS
ncbi:MAG: vitamin B12-dependent ribonucleotide reductase, partial [Acidimicrobiales bacterium]